MITTNTVFILGAGASYQYGFPSGEGLIDAIYGNSDADYIALLNRHGGDVVQNFKEALRASEKTVDEFITDNKTAGFKEIGMDAIAGSIIKLENSPVKVRREGPPKDWYSYLYKAMSGPSLEDFSKNQVSFVTFNYERSLEQFLYTALSAGYADPVGAARQLNQMKFVHVHGQLGFLPWQDKEASQTRPYDGRLTTDICKIGVSGIKVISDPDLDKSRVFTEARRLTQDAALIFFLGFGFHEVNMKRLNFPKPITKIAKGTAYGLTQVEQDRITSKYPGLHLSGETALEFLRNCAEFHPV